MPNPLYLLALHLIDGLGPKRIHRLLSHFENAKNVFHADKESLLKVGKIPIPILTTILAKDFSSAEKEMELARKHDIQILSLDSPCYPSLLKESPDAPPVLFSRGCVDFNRVAPSLSVVGTRDLSSYGEKHSARIVEELVGIYPKTMIISGLAKGIDATAHKRALSAQAYTIAVLAHGFQFCYPPEHRVLAEEIIAKGGALVSEFPYATAISRERFPIRNRIIAGMSEATLVIETQPKGGAMITARLANEYNREVFALPGNVESPRSQGCHQLISQMKAHLFLDTDTMIKMMNWDLAFSKNTPPPSPPDKGKENLETKDYGAKSPNLFSKTPPEPKPNLHAIPEDLAPLHALIAQHENIHIDELMKTMGVDFQEISKQLLTLQLLDLVKELPGNYYALDT